MQTLNIHRQDGPWMGSLAGSICGGQPQGDLGLFQNLFSQAGLKAGGMSGGQMARLKLGQELC